MKKFKEYQDAVIAAYKKKETEGSLTPNLARPTDANLRKECIDEFPTRYNDNDSEIFKSIFGKASNADEYYKKITISEPKIFKPLNQFLRGKTVSTHERYIHLLAWLIDFDPRPFRPVDPYVLGNIDNSTINTVPVATDPTSDHVAKRSEDPTQNIDDAVNGKKDDIDNMLPEDNEHDLSEENNLSFIDRLFQKKNAILAALFIIMGLWVLYILLKPRFMYWNGTEYKSLAFYQDVDSIVFIVPLDPVKLHHLKKIAVIRSISRNSIGIVHYSKIDKKVEFYTTGGKCPEDTTRWLHPMTKYIYNKYVLKK